MVSDQPEQPACLAESLEDLIDGGPSTCDVGQPKTLQLLYVTIQDEREIPGPVPVLQDMAEHLAVRAEVIIATTIAKMKVAEDDQAIRVRERVNRRGVIERLEVPVAESTIHVRLRHWHCAQDYSSV
jgi:hypothetical protein